MKKYTDVNVSDYDLSRVQDSIRQSLDDLISKQLIDGILLENVSLTSGQDNIINHKLSRKLRMWLVVRKNANSDVWEVSSVVSTKQISLRCSANVTISLWVA